MNARDPSRRAWPPGDGEMARRIRLLDWAATPLGPTDGWPQSLHTAVDIMLGSGHAMQLAWGLERIVLYNDAYAPMLGVRHPGALGMPFREAWPDIWDEVEPLVARVFAGETVRFEDMPLVMTRHGCPEDTWWNFSYSPVRDETGAVAGLLNVTVDVTPKVRAEQALREREERQAFLLELNDALRPLADATAIQATTTRLLGMQLDVDRAMYAEVEGEPGAETGTILGQYVRSAAGGRPPADRFPERFTFAPFGPHTMARRYRGEPLVVADVDADPEFEPSEREAWATAGVRAAIVAPLTKNGRLIAEFGVHCAMPRDWTDAEVSLVQQAAERTWADAERARAEEALRVSEERFRLALEIGGLGDWTLDLDGGVLNASAECKANFGYAPDAPFGYETLRSTIHPDDRAAQDEIVNDAIQARSAFAVEYRITAANGEQRWIAASGRFEPDGAAGRLVGVSQDITAGKLAETALRESEEKYRTLFETMGQGYCELELLRDADGRAVDQRYIELNPAYERLIGISVADAKGRTASQVMPDLDPQWTEAFDRIAKRGKAERIEHEVASLGRWFEVFVYPRGGDRLTVLYEDVTDRKRAEDVLRQSEERQAFLLKLSDAVRPQLDPATVAETACAMIVGHLDATRAQFTEVEGDAGAEIGAVHGEHIRSGMPMPRTYPLGAFGDSLVAALRRGETLVLSDAGTDPRIGDAQRTAFADVESPAAIAVPLVKQGRLVATFAVHDAAPRDWTVAEVALIEEVAERTWAAFERAQAEAALRTSERRLAAELSGTQLLQRLSTRLIPEQSLDILHEQILDAAAELMQADAVSIQLLDDDGRRLRRLATRNLHPASTEYWTWVDAGHASTCGQALRTNSRVIAEDVETSAELVGTGDLEAFRRSGTRAVQSTPLVSRSGRPIGMISTHWHEPRRLAEADFGLFDILARQTADLLERVQAEAALRASEERFRQFADASSDGLWIRDAATLDMEYVSPAVGAIYGIEPEDLIGDVSRWLARIVPDDREVAAEHLERARHGNEVEHEFRIMRGSDGAIRWIRNTDFPLRDEAGDVRRIGGIAEDVTDTKEAADRQQVLVGELQHRTRNLIAVVSALVERTLRTAGSLDDFRGRFGHRLSALSRVQGLLSHLAAGEKIGFDELLRAELNALGAIDGDGDRVHLDGPADVPLRSSTVQTFALALHELATNAVKYGALSPANLEGRLAVQWRVDTCDDGARWLRVTWRETGVAMPEGAALPRGGGYGRELIERALPYQLGADTSFDLCPNGVHCTIAVPIAGGGGGMMASEGPSIRA